MSDASSSGEGARRVLIAGAGGQLGRALMDTQPANISAEARTRSDLDIADPDSVQRCVDLHRPEVIINAAAYTNVDRAEIELDVARRVNADGPRNLARAACVSACRLIHVSTDFVFDGTSSRPYRPSSPTHPLNAYGETKEQGEQAIAAIYPDRSVILRTAWLYGYEGQSFVTKIMRAMRANGSVRVIADQVGTPTSATSLAKAIWKIVGAPEVAGIHHWTDTGVASWYDFAVAIAEEAAPLKLLREEVTVHPISTEEYPTPARRPSYSVLDTTSLRALDIAPVHWRKQLRWVLARMAAGEQNRNS